MNIEHVIIYWVLASMICGAVGANKTITAAGAFFISLVFSPPIGILVATLCKRKDEITIVNGNKKEDTAL